MALLLGEQYWAWGTDCEVVESTSPCGVRTRSRLPSGLWLWPLVGVAALISQRSGSAKDLSVLWSWSSGAALPCGDRDPGSCWLWDNPDNLLCLKEKARVGGA